VERSLIYLDASAIMRLVDGDQPARERVESLIRANEGPLVTSVVSLIECRSKPLREADLVRVRQYDAFFSSREMTLLMIDTAFAERATQLRAEFNFKTPDAIHLASALTHAATLLITTDQDFASMRESARPDRRDRADDLMMDGLFDNPQLTTEY
jgi:predicted nucleic acid-binding protein